MIFWALACVGEVLFGQSWMQRIKNNFASGFLQNCFRTFDFHIIYHFFFVSQIIFIFQSFWAEFGGHGQEFGHEISRGFGHGHGFEHGLGLTTLGMGKIYFRRGLNYNLGHVFEPESVRRTLLVRNPLRMLENHSHHHLFEKLENFLKTKIFKVLLNAIMGRV